MSARHTGFTLAALAALLLSARAGAISTCTVSATGPVFGVYNPLSGAALASNGSVVITCTRLSSGGNRLFPTVTLSTGASGGYAPRKLFAGAAVLNYNLYLDAGFTQVWGDGSAGTVVWNTAIHPTRRQPVAQVTGTIYGRVPAGQDVAPGAYADTIIVTVTY